MYSKATGPPGSAFQLGISVLRGSSLIFGRGGRGERYPAGPDFGEGLIEEKRRQLVLGELILLEPVFCPEFGRDDFSCLEATMRSG